MGSYFRYCRMLFWSDNDHRFKGGGREIDTEFYYACIVVDF